MKRVLIAFLLAVIAMQPALAAFLPDTMQFGGTGSQGSLTKSGTESSIQFFDAIDFSIASGQTWSPVSGTRINARGSVNISGTVAVQTSYAQTPTNTNRNGVGIGGGTGASNYQYGGGGGSCGGPGGQGGSFHYTVPVASGGRVYSPELYFCGSAGGSGGWDHANAVGVGGQAGAGGGAISIYAAGPINISSGGLLTLNGGNGAAGSGGTYGTSGGGGGSGGVALLASLKSITVSSTNGIQAKGGSGGNGNGSGGGGFQGGVGAGGGGGGYLILVAPSVNLSGGVDLAGGSAGTPANYGGGGTSAAGSSGVVKSILVVPSMPLLTLLQDQNFVSMVLACKDHQIDAIKLGQLVAAYNQTFERNVCL